MFTPGKRFFLVGEPVLSSIHYGDDVGHLFSATNCSHDRHHMNPAHVRWRARSEKFFRYECVKLEARPSMGSRVSGRPWQMIPTSPKPIGRYHDLITP